MNKKECMSCGNLVCERKTLSIKRKDGSFETAVSFYCSVRKMPLPTLTKHDPPGCIYHYKKEKDGD